MSNLETSQTLQKAGAVLTNSPSGILQRKCASCNTNTIAGDKCEDCDKKGILQRKSNNSAHSDVPPIVHQVLRSSGQPLDKSTRTFFEPHFALNFSRVPVISTLRQMSHSSLSVGEPTTVFEQEADRVADSVMRKGQSENKTSTTSEWQGAKFDLSDVRVHTDARAAESAHAVNALAYTVGRDIVFAAGAYQPTKESGQRLLAHELTHVAQQSAKSNSAMPTIQRQPSASVPAPDVDAANGGLNEQMLKQIARTLREAMKGWGTDEEAIYSAFAGRTQEQVDAISRVYLEMYNVDLFEALSDELNDSEMMHLAIFSPTAVPGEPGSAQQTTALADMIAAQLHKAMKGWGTDEESIYAALTGHTQDELKAIKGAYTRLTNRDLVADIEDEMSGREKIRALSLLNQGMLMPEDEIYLAVQGLGTDEETLFRVLDSVRGDRNKIIQLIDRYASKAYGDLLADVRDDLSNIFGDDLIRSMEDLHGATPTTSCSTDQRNTGLEALSVSISMTQNAVSKADTDIGAGALSGKVETALKENFNPGAAANAVNVTLLRQVRDRLSLVRTNILTLSDVTCVASDPKYCVKKPDCSKFTYGWASINLPASTIRLCNAFFECMTNANDRGRGLVHECAHRTGIRDKFYRHDAGFSTLMPQGDQSATDSLDNADSYAYFAKQLD